MFNLHFNTAARALALLLLLAAPRVFAADSKLPMDWIDPDTGHRVVRLSSEAGTQSLYFHYNGFPKMGDWLIVTNQRGLAMINLDSRETVQLAKGKVRGVISSRIAPIVYYQQENKVYAQDIQTSKRRKILELPEQFVNGSGFGLSCDDKLLAGSYVTSAKDDPLFAKSGTKPDGTHFSLRERWENRRPMALYTINTDSGDIATFHNSTDWLNHVQMSPVDPGLIMFCHEGPWGAVDRTWTIRTDGSGLTKIHPRTMNREIEGHEFFAPDGKIWYDLQTPRGIVFWVAGYNTQNARRVWYNVPRAEWSVHYNIAPDGRTFCGDGGGPKSVASPGNGQWMYHFTPNLNRMDTEGAPEPEKLIASGKFETEKLVNLAKHDYALEPNGSFTPDGKWIVFRSNFQGEVHTYKVEVAKRAAATVTLNPGATNAKQ